MVVSPSYLYHSNITDSMAIQMKNKEIGLYDRPSESISSSIEYIKQTYPKLLYLDLSDSEFSKFATVKLKEIKIQKADSFIVTSSVLSQDIESYKLLYDFSFLYTNKSYHVIDTMKATSYKRFNNVKDFLILSRKDTKYIFPRYF